MSSEREAGMQKMEIAGQSIRLATLAIVSLGWAQLSHALGLGGVEYKSYLGEPLSASIQIIGNDRGLGIDDVHVRAVSPAEAAELGVDLLMSPHLFKLESTQENSGLLIQVSSKTAIREPFVDLLVELQWSKGVIYREYTLLLDLPPRDAEPARALARETPRYERPEPAPEPAKAKPSTLGGEIGGTYRVRSGDSLSRIAKRWSADKSHSRQDTADWILSNNPQAFVGGDANRLIAGAKLNMPEAGFSSAPVPVSGAPEYLSEDLAESGTLLDAPKAAVRPEPARAEGKVYLGNADAAKSEEPDILSKTIRAQVEAAREMNDLLGRENQELRTRIERIENSGYNETFEQIVNLQQQQIDELRRQLAETVASGEERALVAATPEPSTGNQDLAQLEDAGAAAAEQRSEGSESVNPLWWVLLGLGIGAAVVALYGLFKRRESVEKKDKEDSYQEEIAELDEPDQFIETSDLQSQVQEIDVLAEDDLFGGADNNRELPDSIEETSLADDELLNLTLNEDMAPEEVVEEDSVDKMIGTAYIYTSFGKFDEAKALLETQRKLLGDDPRFDLALADIESQRQ